MEVVVRQSSKETVLNADYDGHIRSVEPDRIRRSPELPQYWNGYK